MVFSVENNKTLPIPFAVSISRLHTSRNKFDTKFTEPLEHAYFLPSTDVLIESVRCVLQYKTMEEKIIYAPLWNPGIYILTVTSTQVVFHNIPKIFQSSTTFKG